MTRLQKTKHPDGTSCWQWDDGPLFVGEGGRTCAVLYGQAIQCLEDLRGLSYMQAAHRLLGKEIPILKGSNKTVKLGDK